MRIHIKPLKCTCNSRNDFNRNFIHRNSIINVFFFKMTINWLITVKNYKRPSKVVDFNASDADRVTAKIFDFYSFATTPIYTKRTFYASGLSAIIFMCFRPLGILPYQFLRCQSHMTHLVHHTLNLNGIYTSGKRKTLPFEEKKKISLINYDTKRSRSQKHQPFYSIKDNRRMNDYESPIHWVINSA